MLPSPPQVIEARVVTPASSASASAFEPQPDNEIALLHRVFKHEDERLRLDDSKLKASNKKDALQRLVYLWLYAHERDGRPRVPRSELIDVIKDARLFDSNTAKVFHNAADLSIEGDLIGLRLTGRDRAREYLVGQVPWV